MTIIRNRYLLPALAAAIALAIALLLGTGGAMAQNTTPPAPTAEPTTAPTATPTPATLQAPTVSVARNGSVTWSFTVPSGSTFQTTIVSWEPSDNSGSRQQQTFTDSSTTTYQITGLTLNKEYRITVAVTVQNGEGETSTAQSQATLTISGTPEAPGNVSVVKHSDAGQTPHMDISWSEPTDDGGYAISGYDIDISSDSKATWTRIATNTTSQSNSYHISGIQTHISYYARVRAVNSIGQSEWAVAGPLAIHLAPTAPLAVEPTFNGCTAGPACSVTVTWQAPTSGGTPESYDMRFSSEGLDDLEITGLAPDSTSYTVTLNSYGNYKVEMRSVNHSGTSAWSDHTVFTVADPPGKIGVITATRGDTTLNMSWTVPNNGGSPILSYDIQCKTSKFNNSWLNCWSNITPSGDEGSVFSTTATSINNLISYTVRVRVQNVVAWSEWSDAVTAPPPSAPTQVGGINAVRSDGALTISWSAATGATAYDLRLKESNGSIWVQTKDDISGTTATLTSIDNDKAYIVSIRPENFVGDGTWLDSAVIPVPSTPANPTNVSGTRAGNDINVSWSAVQYATGYDVRYSTDNGQTWTVDITNTSGTSATLKNIPSSTQTKVSVRAKNVHKNSSWVDSATIP